VHFDTALNLAWLLSGVIALAATLGLSRRVSSKKNRLSGWLHLIGVAAIVVALFPYISATDDLLRIEHFNTQQAHQNGSKHSSSDDLLRLYETLDSPLLCNTCRIILTLIFLSLLAAPAHNLVRRSVTLITGRSPPLPNPA
jgi:hypothetical protein